MERDSERARPSAADMITREIITRLEAGTRPWVQPWTGTPVSRPLRACGAPYRGVNRLWLGMTAASSGFDSPFWMTYNQARREGGQVRKGERGTLAIFYKSYARRAEDDDGDPRDEQRRVLRSYVVFNAAQVDGLPERFFPQPSPAAPPSERDALLDGFFAQIPATLVHGGSEAYYSPATDCVTMPEPGLFKDRDHYRATLAHELAHWTGHESRLARALGQRFGSDAYAVEELIAELAAAMIGADLGLPVAHLDHHASYVADWLTVLRADSRAILAAAARAEEAAGLILRLGGCGDDHADHAGAAM